MSEAEENSQVEGFAEEFRRTLDSLNGTERAAFVLGLRWGRKVGDGLTDELLAAYEQWADSVP